MAQKDITSTGNESISNKSTKQRPKPLESVTSMPRTGRLPSDNTDGRSSLSSAERYIDIQSQMLDLNNPASDTQSVASSTTAVPHDQLMQNWREQQINQRHKNQHTRYKYGAPPPSSNNANGQKKR